MAAVQICIEDNGRGISSDLMQAVLRRGIRLDSREVGQGIGLAMVSELLEIYDGDMSFAPSSLGGAKVMLDFQQARPASVSLTN